MPSRIDANSIRSQIYGQITPPWWLQRKEGTCLLLAHRDWRSIYQARNCKCLSRLRPIRDVFLLRVKFFPHIVFHTKCHARIAVAEHLDLPASIFWLTRHKGLYRKAGQLQARAGRPSGKICAKASRGWPQQPLRGRSRQMGTAEEQSASRQQKPYHLRRRGARPSCWAR